MSKEMGCQKALCLVPLFRPHPISLPSLLKHAQLEVPCLHYPRKQRKQGGYDVQTSLWLCCIAHRDVTVCTMSAPDKWISEILGNQLKDVKVFVVFCHDLGARGKEEVHFRQSVRSHRKRGGGAIPLPQLTNCFLKTMIGVCCSGNTAHSVVLEKT